MADEEITILIKAVDEMSATLTKIEGTLEKSNKNIQKQTEATSQSFDKQMGSLLVLGQVANSVDNIFSSYQNLQLRLENATERVANAQDRLSKAQRNLTKIQKDNSASAEDLANAQQEVDSASRSLTISQNNLQRANNMVIGTYINIGVQTLSLIKSMPVLIASIEELTISGIAFAATPLGMTIVAVGLAITTVTLLIKNAKNNQDEYNNSIKNYNDLMNEATNSAGDFQQALDNVLSSQTKMLGETNLPGETKKQQEILDLKKGLIDKQTELTDLNEKSYTVDLATAEGQAILQADQIKRASLEADIQWTQVRIANRQSEYDKTIGAQKQLLEDQIILNKQIKNTETPFDVLWEKVHSFRQELKRAEDDLASQRLAKGLQALSDMLKKTTPTQTSNAFASGYVPGTTTSTPKFTGNWSTGYVQTDFVQRPGQAPVSFSSDDTIIGMKNPGGMTIVINGDNYGVDSDDIAEALYQKISRKISQ